MRIYVAARFDNKQAAREAMHTLETHGHEVTLDWTVFGADGNTRLQAMADLSAVAHSDVFVLLASEHMRGAFVEMGVAMAYCKRVYVVNSPGNMIFYQHPLVHPVGSVEEVIAELGEGKHTWK